ncbi:MAG: hypothetical protein HRT40_09330 [Campylobacteraceae bacterium]|nr:hypothetical protein [Campylobacteraceae bacterium]
MKSNIIKSFAVRNKLLVLHDIGISLFFIFISILFLMTGTWYLIISSLILQFFVVPLFINSLLFKNIIIFSDKVVLKRYFVASQILYFKDIEKVALNKRNTLQVVMFYKINNIFTKFHFYISALKYRDCIELIEIVNNKLKNERVKYETNC